MSWLDDIMELQTERPEIAEIAIKVINLRKTGQFSALEAFEAVFGVELAELLLASEEEFDQMIKEFTIHE